MPPVRRVVAGQAQSSGMGVGGSHAASGPWGVGGLMLDGVLTATTAGRRHSIELPPTRPGPDDPHLLDSFLTPHGHAGAMTLDACVESYWNRPLPDLLTLDREALTRGRAPTHRSGTLVGGQSVEEVVAGRPSLRPARQGVRLLSEPVASCVAWRSH
jgi:hypothetical protein